METDLTKIGPELKKIWDKLEAAGTMRASLFNLIVVAPDTERRSYVQKITQNVIKRFPCRVIFISVVDVLEEIKINVSAMIEEGGASCDLIEIAAPSKLLSKIPFLILPHFLPDLPIYLLWADKLSSHPELMTALKQWSTRLIFDSELEDDLKSFSKTLLLQSKEREVADLNWARTENWRELLASTFYSPARLASLQDAKTVEICYNDYETPFFCHTQIQALYIKAWLTSCLKFSPKFTLTPKINKELAPGTVLSMEIICKDQNHFNFERDPHHPHQVRTIICDEDKCDIPSRYIFTKAQTGLSLVNLIYHPDPSTHFIKVLQNL